MARSFGRQAALARVEQLAIIHPHAAGLDISADEMIAAVPPDCDDQPVRAFGTFTVDLYHLADWLVQSGIDTVAMESTGVYWIPSFEVLEARGITVNLVNARHVKAVPGRKSDWNDAQWLQQLHAFGYSAARSVRMRRCVSYARISGIAQTSSSIGRRIFCTCRKHCCR